MRMLTVRFDSAAGRALATNGTNTTGEVAQEIQTTALPNMREEPIRAPTTHVTQGA